MRSRRWVLSFYSSILVLSFTTLAFGTPPRPAVQVQDVIPFAQFELLDGNSGWVLIGERVFWTSDMGQSWSEIGPSIPSGASTQDVEFIDSATGWLLWSIPVFDGSFSFQLAHTVDGGLTWTVESLALFEPGEVASIAEKAQMGWFDTQTGWLSVKQATGSNFSVGTLFTTSDGGSIWRRASLPVADNILFRDPQLGWAVGEPAYDQAFQTQDGGLTWRRIEFDSISSDTLVTAHMPFSLEDQRMVVMTNVGSQNSLEVYSLDPSAGRWRKTDGLMLDVAPDVIGLSILDQQNFVATIPGTRYVVRMQDGGLSVLENQDRLSASIVELDMASLDAGWGRSVEAECEPGSAREAQAGSVSCSSITRLIRTLDGGLTWQILDLPDIESSSDRDGALSSSRALRTEVLSGPGNTQVLLGQGFDKCEIPTLSQLQAWAGNGPYQAVNLYIGGSSRNCDNSSLNASFLRRAFQQGWRFIPTWVGPQAPCTGYLSRMSSDPTTAFNQGVAEANLAVERLAELALTYPDKTGSVVYYDIEHYDTDSSCRNAVNSFMNGWVSQLHARGNLAGVYGSTLCNTGLSDFLTITHVPDQIWAARWYHNMGFGYYDSDASVWNLGSCIPNTVWTNHQRIRQYEGDHDESWGNLPLRIDSNVLDGVVAIPYGFFASSIFPADVNPTNATSVSFHISFPEPVTGVDRTDFILSISGVTGASIIGVSGSGSNYAVTVNTGSGNGTLRLDLIDDDSIRNGADEPLGGDGAGNGSYTQGKPYTVIKTENFADVPSSHWAWQSIERLYATDITGGCMLNPLQYCPEATVTRAQMAVFLERAIHGSSYVPLAVGGSTGFNDVPPGYWAVAWIKQLSADGITGGCGGGNFCPDAPVTRAQMAVFLLKARYNSSYAPPPLVDSTGFGDVPAAYWAADWIKQLVMEGITAGCGSGNYCPGAPVTRAQMAVFLVRTFKLP